MLYIGVGVKLKTVITITKLGPSSGSSSDTIIRKTLRGSRKGKTKSKSFCIAKADKKFKGLKK